MPSEANNRQIVINAPRRMEPTWGVRPCHVIEPGTRIVRRSRYKYPSLPTMRYYAWLTSGSLDKKRFGSELVGAWFAEPPIRETPFVTILEPVIRDLAWERLAADYDP